MRRAWQAALLAALLLALAAAGCAKSSDVEKVADANRVQDERLKALEGDVGRTLREQQQLLESLRTDVRALRGQVQLVNERTGRIAGEQSAMAQEMERTLAEQRKIARQVEDERAALRRFRLESANDLDKMRTRITDLDKLLRSPISRMPDKTAADAALRQSYFHLLNGEFDIAASQFQQFMKKHPKDPRRIEALYRRGQAFFLLRRYDHA
ncbi:MAG: hypothetical protein GWO16_15070, partial [Gammaproteobacteria bacterium]|nr:hypothetical protein [Gammaproteobacteria bacterium]